MQMDTAKSLLCAILRCGHLDLDLLDDVEYDWDDVLERIEWEDYTFNDVMRAVFDLGIIDIRNAVENRIDELDGYDGRDEEEQCELEALKELDPGNDFASWHNYQDTSIWCEAHGELYQKYLHKELDHFEEMTGFAIEIL